MSAVVEPVSTGSTSYLVTGASRGLGFELTAQLLAHASLPVVVAGARSPQTATALQTLASQHPGRLHIIKLDTADETSIKAAAQWVDEHLDGRLDVLINNAGIAETNLNWNTAGFDEATHVFRVNVVGPLVLSSALLPALRRGNKKVIVHMSSELGSVTKLAADIKPLISLETTKESSPFSTLGGVYRASKAALNMEMLIMAGDLASEGFTVVSLHPGWVATDMGSAYGNGVFKPPLTPEQSVKGMLSVLDNLTPRDNGSYVTYNGSIHPW